jgi:hypothetical protein
MDVYLLLKCLLCLKCDGEDASLSDMPVQEVSKWRSICNVKTAELCFLGSIQCFLTIDLKSLYSVVTAYASLGGH